MPIMRMPAASDWTGHPVMQGLMQIAAKLGLNDPQAVMGVGVPNPLPAGSSVASGAVQGLKGAVPNLASEASSYFGPVAETLGERNPFFTPQGGEEMYNLGKAGANAMTNPLEGVYKSILQKGGR